MGAGPRNQCKGNFERGSRMLQAGLSNASMRGTFGTVVGVPEHWEVGLWAEEQQLLCLSAR